MDPCHARPVVGGPSCSACFRCSGARPEEVAASRPRRPTATIRSASRRRRCPTSRAPRRPDSIKNAAGHGDATAGEGDDTGLLLVDDPAVLTALEANGASLGEMLAGPAGKALDNDALAKLPRYASLIQVLQADIGEIARADPNAGVSVARSSNSLFGRVGCVPRRGPLRAPTGVVIDSIEREHRRCGEIRLIYAWLTPRVIGAPSVAPADA